MNLGRGAIAPLQKEHTDVSDVHQAGRRQAPGGGRHAGTARHGRQRRPGRSEQGKEGDGGAGGDGAARRAEVGEGGAHARSTRSSPTRSRRSAARSLARRKGALASTGQQAEGHEERAREEARDDVATEINGRYKATQDQVKKPARRPRHAIDEAVRRGQRGRREGLRGRRQPRAQRVQGRSLLGLVRLGAQGEGLAARHGQAAAGQGDLRPQSRRRSRSASASWWRTSPPTTSA